MIKLAGIGHVLLRVADEEVSKRFYRDVLGFRVAEQDPEHGGVFMTLGDGFHTLDITQHPAPTDAVRPERGQLGLVHIAFKVDSYAGLRDAYAHLLGNGVELQRALDHVCQRSIYFTDPDGNGLEIYYEMRDALTYSRTAAATRTSACRSLVPQSRCPPGSSKTGPARPLSRRSNACANRHHPQRSDRVGGKRRRISPEFASSLAGALQHSPHSLTPSDTR
jgi:catechol 2,3-dioxygenase